MPETWQAFISRTPPRPPFLVEPIVPEGGVTLLYGKRSLGKSALAWNLASAVADGLPFLGLPTRPGGANVAFLELDTPDVLVHERLALLSPPKRPVHFSWLGPGGVDILNLNPRQSKEVLALASTNPDLLIVNTLRKSFRSSANDSDVPAKVYGVFAHYFPSSAFFFVHHDRKDTVQDGAVADKDEAFSGSGAWIDGAQVGLHLVRSGKNLRLDVTKSQVSERFSISLQLDPDGSHVRLLADVNEEKVEEALLELPPNLSLRETDRWLAERLGVSERTARRHRLLKKGGTATS